MVRAGAEVDQQRLSPFTQTRRMRMASLWTRPGDCSMTSTMAWTKSVMPSQQVKSSSNLQPDPGSSQERVDVTCIVTAVCENDISFYVMPHAIQRSMTLCFLHDKPQEHRSCCFCDFCDSLVSKLRKVRQHDDTRHFLRCGAPNRAHTNAIPHPPPSTVQSIVEVCFLHTCCICQQRRRSLLSPPDAPDTHGCKR